MQDPYRCWCTISVVARESGFLKIQGEGDWQKFVCKSWGRHGKQLKITGPSWARPGAAFALSLK